MTATSDSLAWRDAAVASFRYHKNLADRAVAQISDEGLRRALDGNVNSIAVIMKHVAGNLRSRWTDFLTADGEKPWRNRDDEFVDAFSSRDELLAAWEAGWSALFGALDALAAADFDRTVAIRGEAHSVALAIQRSLAHTCYHVGQIVLLARHEAGDVWETLTIPRGGSAAHNQAAWGANDYGQRSK
jgi:uncharacterized damage-inducible protein DinB